MKFLRIAAVCFLALILCSTILPSVSQADELVVNSADTTCSTTSTTSPTCYTSIQAAIDSAAYLNLSTTQTTSVYSVLVEPGQYAENITLHGITVRGRETERTYLYSSGSGTLATADYGSSSISNMTFYGGTIGTAVTGTASLTLVNNIFSANSTGVQVTSASAIIQNNVFYGNVTAISSNVDLTITNNIFNLNTTALSAVSPVTTWNNATYNDFYLNTSDSNVTINSTTGNIASDPLFVNTTANDFHLQTGSPCTNTGNPSYPNTLFGSTSSDMGAYGGAYTDTIPSMVSGVTTSIGTNSITVTWTADTNYLTYGYHVYYGSASGVYDGTGAAEGSSPITVTGSSSTSATLSGLSTSVSISGAPTLNPLSVRDSALDLSWGAVSGATGYKVYWGTTLPLVTFVDVGAATSYSLTGLTNGTTYYTAVTAYAQPTYYVAVTALYSSSTYIPGEQYESAYSETSASFSGGLESAMSNIVYDFPEALVAYPNLPNTKQGCFIATAAYGFYSAPEVQALRVFRDRYLETNRAGRAFVQWYYAHSPAAAAWLEEHPELKPVVRAVLLPAVGIALVTTKSSLAVLAMLLLSLFILMIAILAKRFSVVR